METIRSYGIIPRLKVENSWHYLLVHHQEGHWSFPKGHPISGELPQHCAQREFLEETGITTCHITQPSRTHDEEYEVEEDGQPGHKIVTYYLGVIDGEVALSDSSISDDRITAYRILPYNEAVELITYEGAKQVLRWADKIDSP